MPDLPPAQKAGGNTASGRAASRLRRNAAPAPQQQAALSPPPRQEPRQDRREAASPPKATLGSSVPGYTAPQPDLSIKYNVMLGLPPELPVAASGPGQKDGDGYDASARFHDGGRFIQRDHGIPAASENLLEIAGVGRAFRFRAGQAAGIHDAGRAACRRSRRGRRQRQHQGDRIAAKRDRCAEILPALCDAATGPLRRMEGADLTFTPKDFDSRPGVIPFCSEP